MFILPLLMAIMKRWTDYSLLHTYERYQVQRDKVQSYIYSEDNQMMQRLSSCRVVSLIGQSNLIFTCLDGKGMTKERRIGRECM